MGAVPFLNVKAERRVNTPRTVARTTHDAILQDDCIICAVVAHSVRGSGRIIFTNHAPIAHSVPVI